jgi:hypothetical protein
MNIVVYLLKQIQIVNKNKNYATMMIMNVSFSILFIFSLIPLVTLTEINMFDADSRIYTDDEQHQQQLFYEKQRQLDEEKDQNLQERFHTNSGCYDTATGRAKKCMPEFINAAYGLKIIASNTCGIKEPTEFCMQSNLHNIYHYNNYDYGDDVAGKSSQGDYDSSNQFVDRIHPRCEVTIDNQSNILE